MVILKRRIKNRGPGEVTRFFYSPGFPAGRSKTRRNMERYEAKSESLPDQPFQDRRGLEGE